MLTSKMASAHLSSADSQVPIEMLDTTIPWFLKTSSITSANNGSFSEIFYNENNIKRIKTENHTIDNEGKNMDIYNGGNDELLSDKPNDISPTVIKVYTSTFPTFATNTATSAASGRGDLMGGMRGGLLAKQHLNDVLEVYFKNEDYIDFNENTDNEKNIEHKIKFTNLTDEKITNNVKSSTNEQMSSNNDNTPNGSYLPSFSGLVSSNTAIPSAIKKLPSTLTENDYKLVSQRENNLNVSSTLHCNRNALITHNKNHIDFSAYRISSSSTSSLIKEICTNEKTSQKFNKKSCNENPNAKSQLSSSNTHVSKEYRSELRSEDFDKIQKKNCITRHQFHSNDLLGQLNNYKISRNFNEMNSTKEKFYEPLYADISALDSSNDFYNANPCIKTQNNLAVVMDHINDDYNEKHCKESLKRTCSSSYDSAYLSINSNESNNKIKNQKLSNYVIKKDTSDKYMIHKSIFEDKGYRENHCNITEFINGKNCQSSKLNTKSSNCTDNEYGTLNNGKSEETSENFYMEPISSNIATTSSENFNSESINCYTTTFPTLEKQNKKSCYCDEESTNYHSYLVHNNSNFRRTKSEFNVNGKKPTNIEYNNQIKYIKNLKLSSLNTNTFIDMNNKFRHLKNGKQRPSSDYFQTNWVMNVPDVIMTHDLFFKPSGEMNKFDEIHGVKNNILTHNLNRPLSHYSGQPNMNHEKSLPNPLNQWENIVKQNGLSKMGFSNLSLDKNKISKNENSRAYSAVIVNSRYNSFNLSKNKNRNFNELSARPTSFVDDSKNETIVINNRNTFKNDDSLNVYNQIGDNKGIETNINDSNIAGIAYRRNSMKVTKNRWNSFKKTFSVILEKNNKNENLFEKKLDSDYSVKIDEKCDTERNNDTLKEGLIVKNHNFDEKNFEAIKNETRFYGRCNSIDFLDDCPNNQWKETRSKR